MSFSPLSLFLKNFQLPFINVATTNKSDPPPAVPISEAFPGYFVYKKPDGSCDRVTPDEQLSVAGRLVFGIDEGLFALEKGAWSPFVPFVPVLFVHTVFRTASTSTFNNDRPQDDNEEVEIFEDSKGGYLLVTDYTTPPLPLVVSKELSTPSRQVLSGNGRYFARDEEMRWKVVPE